MSGVFYRGRGIYNNGGMVGKRAFAAFSLGGRGHMFGPDAIHGELETGMLRHFLQGALGYCGFEVLEPFIAYHTPYLPLEEQQLALTELGQQIGTLDDRPVMPMPSLTRFDNTFAPLK